MDRNAFIYNNIEPKTFYFSNIDDICSWDRPYVKTAVVSKWRWLLQQFLCVIGFSKRPSLYVGIDMGKEGGDHTVEVTGFINECGNFEINSIKELPTNNRKDGE